MKVFDTFCELLRKVIGVICVGLLCAQVLLVSGVAISRYLFKYTPAWGENSALLCMVWFCLLCATLALYDDSHLRMTLIDNVAPPKAIRIMNIIDMVLVFVFGAFMLFEGVGLVQLTARNIMTGLGIPASILYASVPVSGLAFMIVSIEKAKELISQLKKGEK